MSGRAPAAWPWWSYLLRRAVWWLLDPGGGVCRARRCGGLALGARAYCPCHEDVLLARYGSGPVRAVAEAHLGLYGRLTRRRLARWADAMEAYTEGGVVDLARECEAFESRSEGGIVSEAATW